MERIIANGPAVIGQAFGAESEVVVKQTGSKGGGTFSATISLDRLSRMRMRNDFGRIWTFI
jgi:hypothetical protein